MEISCFNFWNVTWFYLSLSHVEFFGNRGATALHRSNIDAPTNGWPVKTIVACHFYAPVPRVMYGALADGNTGVYRCSVCYRANVTLRLSAPQSLPILLFFRGFFPRFAKGFRTWLDGLHSARLRGFLDVCRSFRSTVFDLFDKFDLIGNRQGL